MNTQDDFQDDELVEKPAAQEPRKPGTFTKGDPRINRGGTRGSEVPQLLRDLRHVYNKPKNKDRTQGQKMLRKLFEKAPEKFLYRLQKAEADYRAAQQESQAPGASPDEKATDPGTEKSLAAIDQLLRRYSAERAREDAEFAQRPDAAAMGATLQRRLAEAVRREEALRAEVDQLRRRA
jgi:hypothetical protein